MVLFPRLHVVSVCMRAPARALARSRACVRPFMRMHACVRILCMHAGKIVHECARAYMLEGNVSAFVCCVYVRVRVRVHMCVGIIIICVRLCASVHASVRVEQ